MQTKVKNVRLHELDSSTSNLKAASETFSSFLSVYLLQDLFCLSAESTIRKEVSVLSAGVDHLYSEPPKWPRQKFRTITVTLELLTSHKAAEVLNIFVIKILKYGKNVQTNTNPRQNGTIL